ncbi:MAG: ABC transporter ATP-binding protein [Anaerolineales bacterium]|nr:ABC transporter ATP-binding protein [Anaerolineales bacterium]
MYAIEVRDVSKRYKLYHDRSYTLKDRILFNRSRYDMVWVLEDINLNIDPGVCLGLIGVNGSGKSTLLKLITRIIYPNKGSIAVNGRVTSLLELGAGFHADMTGRENIYTNASIYGLSRREITEKMDTIIAFSELEDFIDSPIRTYSSGMYMRLAFSVSINVSADILLIDEILAVGDENFQQKCYQKILDLKGEGKTVVIVSHDMAAVRRICDRTVWLANGRVRDEGKTGKVVDVYLSYMKNRQPCGEQR